MIKTIFSAGSLLAGFLLTSLSAHAGVMTFDDLAVTANPSMTARSPYKGLNWGTNWLLGQNTLPGYGNAAHSGTQFVFNARGANNLLDITSATPFTFLGAWFAAPDITGTRATSITVKAYDGLNALIGSTSVVGLGSTFKEVAANFSGVTRLTITRDKGFFVMDDLKISRPGEVPEPATFAMLGLGLALIGAARRSRSK
jgi:hypothetical protein